MKTTTIFLFMSFIFNLANADLLIESKKVLLTKGYTPVRGSNAAKLTAISTNIVSGTPTDLEWPVTLLGDYKNSVGFGLAQIQNNWAYKDYFHGGCDLVAQEGSDVIAPVSGTVDAGYYAYSAADDGTGALKKFWVPLDQAKSSEVNPNYFEIAIITPDGFRLELHHIDPKKVSPKILDLYKNKQQIQAGEKVGVVKDFPYKILSLQYHHIHYNVIAKDGQRINCEWVSKPLHDTEAPEILSVYGFNGIKYEKIENGKKTSAIPAEILVQTVDYKSGRFFPQQPAKVGIFFTSGEQKVWDFKYSILDEYGFVPKISDVYKLSFETTTGEVLKSTGEQDLVKMYFRFQVPATAHGGFKIVVEDFFGNQTEFSASLPGQQI